MESYPSIQTQFIGLLQGHQKAYYHKNSESKADTSPKIDIEFKEISPYQEGIISEAYQRPDKSYFQELKN